MFITSRCVRGQVYVFVLHAGGTDWSVFESFHFSLGGSLEVPSFQYSLKEGRDLNSNY